MEEIETFCVQGFTPQMSIRTEAGPGWSQEELGTSPTWVAGT